MISGKNVLVTGATGFIGQHLVNALLEEGASVIVLSRRPPSETGRKYKTVVGDLTNPATLEGICDDVDIVFHLGGYAHALDQLDEDSEKINWEVTVEGTRALVGQSLKAGVERFIFFSSVKAMGEGGESCIDETMDSQAASSYGKAKREAEKLVLESGRQGMSPTVFRLPMVYGPGCKGNLPRMIRAVARGYFPPLPETGNRRSMVDVRDVVQAALLAAGSPSASGKIYIVTDGQAYSTRQIYDWIRAALSLPTRQRAIPMSMLRIIAHIGDVVAGVIGRRFVFDSDALVKLTGSAWYSSEKISRELNYRPAHTLKDSLPEMVAESAKNA
jgi:UDP-glucose 4-epimerase